MIRNAFDENYREILVEWLESHSGDVRLSEDSNMDETRISITPLGSNTCPLLIASRNGSTQIHLGKSIHFDEIDDLRSDDGAKLTTKMSGHEFRSLLDAVLSGSVRETVMYKQDVIIKSSGEVQLNGKTYKTRTTTLRALFCRPDRRVDHVYSRAVAAPGSLSNRL